MLLKRNILLTQWRYCSLALNHRTNCIPQLPVEYISHQTLTSMVLSQNAIGINAWMNKHIPYCFTDLVSLYKGVSMMGLMDCHMVET